MPSAETLRSALVTGASAGIGRAIARSLSEAGFRTCIVARRAALLESLAKEIAEAGGPPPEIIVADLMDEEAPGRIVSQCLDAVGVPFVLVNNAGGSRPFTLETDEAQWEEAMMLNFTRPRQLAHVLLPHMINVGAGRIINITGKSEPEGMNGAFCAKAALHSWAKGLSREVGPHGITVNCIAPGRIMSEQIERNYSPEYRAEQSATEIPMRHYGTPEDVANLVRFLASDEAGYMTGTVIPVDGGLRRYQF